MRFLFVVVYVSCYYFLDNSIFYISYSLGMSSFIAQTMHQEDCAWRFNVMALRYCSLFVRWIFIAQGTGIGLQCLYGPKIDSGVPSLSLELSIYWRWSKSIYKQLTHKVYLLGFVNDFMVFDVNHYCVKYRCNAFICFVVVVVAHKILVVFVIFIMNTCLSHMINLIILLNNFIWRWIFNFIIIIYDLLLQFLTMHFYHLSFIYHLFVFVIRYCFLRW